MLFVDFVGAKRERKSFVFCCCLDLERISVAVNLEAPHINEMLKASHKSRICSSPTFIIYWDFLRPSDNQRGKVRNTSITERYSSSKIDLFRRLAVDTHTFLDFYKCLLKVTRHLVTEIMWFQWTESICFDAGSIAGFWNTRVGICLDYRTYCKTHIQY